MSSLRLGHASCAFAKHSKGRFIYCLETDRNARKQGHAKRLLRAIRKWAERTNTIVGLHIGPYKDRPMDYKQLEVLYLTMGFRSEARPNGVMWLTPRRKK